MRVTQHFKLSPLKPTSILNSVGALYLYSGDSIRKHTAGGLETALGEPKLCSSFHLSPNPCRTYLFFFTRRFRTPFPFFDPEVHQGPNPCFVDGLVSRYWRILRQDGIQFASGLDSLIRVGTSHEEASL